MFFRYLEEDPSTTVLERRRELKGYEVYVVEQWACSRVHPTFVITTFTGLPQHSVFVGVLSIPTNEEIWSPRLRVYLCAMSKFHARKKETPLGTLMVTNLSGFPSALTVIPVPGGDVKSHREAFIVNEDMKRLGCSGRAGMTLSPPIGATQAKFLQLYHTNDQIPVSRATIELVKLSQVALVLFTKLAPEYADGLLCDVTERAINDWWTDVGTEYYNVEPGDGILGPTTVSALLGMLVGARNRLNACGAPVAKDVFDLKATKRGIAYFQKSQKLPRSRRFDRQTLDRLHRVTSKAASGEGWTVPKAVKSTVVELSGKGGEMMMGMVGGRDRGGIAEVESLDIELFSKHVTGESAKWLWHGKPRKNNNEDFYNAQMHQDEMVFSGDDSRGYLWASRKRDSMVDESSNYLVRRDHLLMQPSQNSEANGEPLDGEPAFKKTVFKSVTGRMSDAKSGLGRIKDAVGLPGLRGHQQQRFSKEIDSTVYMDNIDEKSLKGDGSFRETISAPPSPKNNINSTTKSTATNASDLPSESARLYSQESSSRFHEELLSDEASRVNYSPSIEALYEYRGLPNYKASLVSEHEEPHDESKDRYKPLHSAHLSDNMRINHALDRPQPFTSFIREPALPSLHSTQSLSQLSDSISGIEHHSRWPRHLSFSTVDDIFTNLDEEPLRTRNDVDRDVQAAIFEERYITFKTLQMMTQIQQLTNQDVGWMKRKVANVEELDIRAARDRDNINALHYQRFEEHRGLQEAIRNLIDEQNVSLMEALRDIEVLGAKLEYELSTLQSKVEDVEDGVTELDRQVLEIEARVQEIVEGDTADPWFHWIIKVFSGGVK